jgi:hypothetical protein
MAWIESHQSLGTHIKLRRLARTLGILKPQAVGHLYYLWWWALDGAPSGDVSALSAAELAEVSEWPGDPEAFLAALRDCGWLDPDGRIHDWEQYVGRILSFRENNRKRQRRRRKALRHGAVTRDVRVTSRVRSDAVAGLQYSTVPTVPTLPVCVSPIVDTQPEDTHTEGTHTDSCWPTLDEVLQRAELRGIPKDCAEKWWHEHDARGGCDRHGQPLKRWESALIAFATSWRAVEAQQKARSHPPVPDEESIDWSKGFFGDETPAQP